MKLAVYIVIDFVFFAREGNKQTQVGYVEVQTKVLATISCKQLSSSRGPQF